MVGTRVTELLNIRYPILQGGLQWLSRAELASAVSEAGGLGIITAGSFSSKRELKEEIRKMRRMTIKPFGVNISMLPTVGRRELIQDYFDTVCEEGIRVVETSGRNPEAYVKQLKEAGVKLIHKVPSVRYAKKAEFVGADAVTIVGFECGGHPGIDDVTSLIKIPRTVDSVKIPVIAGGGIVDARGFIASLSLGAEAVVMGTRFLATKECPVHPRFKEWIVKAQETDTIIIQQSINNTTRVMKNKAAAKVLEMENRGATLEELMNIISGQVGKKAYETGDIDLGTIPCGQVVGLIREVPTVKELIEKIMEDVELILSRINRIFSGLITC